MTRRRRVKSVSEVMASIHSRDTKPEMVVRRWLWGHGYRYRKNVGELPGKPDIVVGASRTAIFVNGCFWHQHEGCRNYSTPRTNTEFWQRKFERNKARDARVRDELRAKGWRTMVIWECQLKAGVVEETMVAVAQLLDMAREEWESLRPSVREHTQIASSPTPPSRGYDLTTDSDITYMAAEDEMSYGEKET